MSTPDPHDEQSFAPDWAVPPGEMVTEAIVDRGWTIFEAREQLGWSRALLLGVLDNHVGIDPALAADLALVFGNSTEYWLNLQRLYDEWLVRQP